MPALESIGRFRSSLQCSAKLDLEMFASTRSIASVGKHVNAMLDAWTASAFDEVDTELTLQGYDFRQQHRNVVLPSVRRLRKLGH